MATGSIRIKPTKSGEVRYQITVEGERDPLTGKRNRIFRNVKGSKREANAVMHKMITEMEQGRTVQKSDITVSEWMDEWLSLYMPNIEETTRVGYKTKIKCYINPAIGHIKISSLRAEHVQMMVNGMIEKELSPKNIRDAYNNVKAAMKKAVVLRYLPYNPCEGVVLPKLKRYRAKVYDSGAIAKLLTAARESDMFLPILLCVAVGLRRGEMLALRWEDIDFHNKVIKIRSNMVRGEKSIVIKAPKSESGIRDIAVGDEVLDELRRERAKYMTDAFEYGSGFQNLGFVVRQADGSPFRPDSMTRKWEKFLEAAGLPKIRLHDLRHSNATALIQAGVNPRVVQQRLVHSDVSTTLRFYTHVLPEMDAQAAETLDNIMMKRAKA